MTVPANVSTVILSEAKNLPIRGMRYFTALRSFSMTNFAESVIFSEAKNLSNLGMRYFTSLRYVQYDKQRRVSF